jgi:hypothetical protein
MKPVEEMSEAEMYAFVEEGSGVKRPVKNATDEERAKWFVATIFMLFARAIPDAKEAEAHAVAELVRSNSFPAIRPYIEEALGRPLTAKARAHRPPKPAPW